MGYTSEQMEAITFRDCDILVAAAAGSGKTAVLVERIISMITSKESPVNVNSLLVVTFTKASAGEMRGRIAEAISKKLESDTKNSHLQNQLIYLNRADIKTIHSFCLQVIKENIHLIDMDPSFRTADPSESKLLQKEVLEDIFEELYENQEDIDFFTLVETFGEDTKDDRLKGLVLDIYSFIQGCLLPFAWLDEMVEDYKIENNDLENIKWMPILRQGIVSEMQDAYKKLTQAKNCAISTIGFEDYQKNIEATLTTIDIFLSQDGQSFANMADNFKKISFDKLKGYKGEDIETAKKIQEYRDNAKKQLNMLKRNIFATDQKPCYYIYRSFLL